ncbi:major facilitator superfamily domain-containing protein [Achaetomium macrosporum]|uniref:Major facilitator superfamily domain-containing protein n=1 Tax=Achaetomium macrosporum TaxID=79813 RepID=A0AAN7HDF4_9PEZI|nr:major facilitator superfamily domain-containing protein [Achaetomium macrosporum]
MTVGTDDTQPLLRSVTHEGHQVYTDPAPALQDGTADIAADTTIVDFDPNGDAENPLEWPTPFKWAVVSMLAFMAFTVTFTCISVVPLASDIVRDLSGSADPSKSASVLLVTIWELGEAAGPLLIAPLSEMFGRYPVMNAANVLFIVATVLAATSASVPQCIVARMLNGLAVASNVLNPAIVGDMFASEERGSALSLIYLAPLIGGAIGPLIGSAVAQALGWRTVLWATAVLASACEVLFLTCFRETYKLAILRRRVRKLVSHHGAGFGKTFKTAFDDAEGVGEHASSDWRKLRDAVLRPAIVWCESGVLMAMSLFSSVTFAFYYVYSTTFSDILVDMYELSPVTIGSCFTIFSVGSTLSVFLCNSTLDRIYIRMRDTHKGVGKPEFRLPLAILGAFALPLSIAAYGWASELHLPLVFLLFAVCAMGTALMLAMIPVMAYVVDGFGLYSASAMTGVIVTRCLMGTFLPLTTTPLVDMFGYGWGFTVLAGFGLLLAPIPIVMLRYGAYWRKFSKYSRDA